MTDRAAVPLPYRDKQQHHQEMAEEHQAAHPQIRDSTLAMGHDRLSDLPPIGPFTKHCKVYSKISTSSPPKCEASKHIYVPSRSRNTERYTTTVTDKGTCLAITTQLHEFRISRSGIDLSRYSHFSVW
ncbi:hypothetical protein MRB53_040269 [Persea americana]|nr:hypothetical protein MRB53_040269 [Persea americana]